nr:MFS transporter [Kibdelosporangium phytohabitans]
MIGLSPLALGSGAIGTSSYSIASLLPAVSQRLSVSPAAGGQLVTVFALACAVSCPAVAMVASVKGWDRRRLVLGALVIAGLGNACCALASTPASMFAARILTALGSAVYVPAATSLAATRSAPHRSARAIAVVLSGLSASLLLGIPATSSGMNLLHGDQGVFWSITALCLISAGVIAAFVPSSEHPTRLGTTAPKERRTSRVGGQSMLVLAVTLLATLATFMVYTYITLILAVPSADGMPMVILLSAYGVGAVAGTLLGGRAADRWHPAWVVLVATAMSAIVLLLLGWVIRIPASPVVVALVLTGWGCACWAIYSPLSAWLSTPVLMSFNTAAVYAGMAIGGLLGGVVVAETDPSTLVPVAAAAALAASCVVVVARPRSPVPE